MESVSSTTFPLASKDRHTQLISSSSSLLMPLKIPVSLLGLLPVNRIGTPIDPMSDKSTSTPTFSATKGRSSSTSSRPPSMRSTTSLGSIRDFIVTSSTLPPIPESRLQRPTSSSKAKNSPTESAPLTSSHLQRATTTVIPWTVSPLKTKVVPVQLDLTGKRWCLEMR